MLESPAGALLRSAFATVASLGALHSLAGATTQLVASVNQPARATVGAAFSETVTVTGLGVSYAQSWSVGNTLPPGIAAQGAVLQDARWVVNPSNGTLALSGTPTAAGTYNFSISGYQYTSLTGPVTTASAQIVVAAAANAAPVLTTQPASATAIVGGSATFTVTFTGTPTPTIQWLKNGAAIAGANSASFTLSNVTAVDGADYSVQLTNSLGSVTSTAATLTVSPAPAAPAFTTLPVSQTVTAGGTVTFTVAVSGVPTPTLQWLKDGSGINGATGTTLTLANVQTADAGAYAVTASSSSSTVTSAAAMLTVNLVPGLPVFSSSPQSQTAAAGAAVTLTATATGNPSPTYLWQFNGANLAGATSATLTLSNLQPANAGLYTALGTNSFGTTASDPAIVGVSTTSKVIGSGSQVGSNIVHPNGNIFDQVLLSGVAATMTADPGKVTRTSFIDLTDDIVQVEFSGAGTLSLVLDNATGPAAPVSYNQPTVGYMKGHAGIVITGANETTNVSVFTVGRATAFDPTGAFNILLPISATNVPANNGSSLFAGHASTAYDGIADIAFIAISSTNGKFGGVRTSNAQYFATKGYTGVYAPGVQFAGPVFVGNISAFDAATPVLMIGSSPDTRIIGGDLLQPNGQPVKVSGLTQLKFTAGGDSHGNGLSAKVNRAVLQQNGSDVTAQVVVNPDGTIAPTITSPPIGQTVLAGESAIFTAAATGVPTPALQWQVSTNGGSAWANLSNSSPYSGVTTSNLIITSVTVGLNNNQYRCVATNSGGNATSLAATLVLRGLGTTGQQFVTVGQGGTILTSPDGVTWTGRSSGTTKRLRAATASGNLFVVVGETGTVLTSPDGVGWTARTSGTTQTLRGVTAGPSRFVAVGGATNSLILYSSDGVVWSPATVPALGALRGVIFGNGLFVAVGQGGTILSSADGVVWTHPTTSISERLDGVVWTGTQFVIISQSGQVLTSTDAITWSASSSSPPSWLESLAWSDASYVVVGAAGQIATSPTGAFWTAVPSGTANTIHGVTWSGGSFTPAGNPVSLLTNLQNMPAIITQAVNTVVVMGTTASFSVGASGSGTLTYQWRFNDGAISDDAKYSGTTSPTLTISSVQGSDTGNYDVVVTGSTGSVISNQVTLSFGTAPIFTSNPANLSVAAGASATFSAAATGTPAPTLKWQFNGSDVSGATNPALPISNVQPANAGIYRALALNVAGSALSTPAILGVTTTSKVIGAAYEVNPNYHHPNGNIYDEMLLTGAAATVTADAGQITRVYWVDLNDDIVAAELTGAGSLTIRLDNVSGPAVPVKYNQPSVNYMKGHAGLVVVGANETTNVAVFSVGRMTSVDQSIIRTDVIYDGYADIAFIAISSTNGQFGGVRTSNARFSAAAGVTGVFAPGVTFTGPFYLGDLDASGLATPMLVFGSVNDVRITGGDLLQANGQPILVSGFTVPTFTDGTDSNGQMFPAQTNRGQFVEYNLSGTSTVPVITSATTATAPVGAAFTYTITASNSPTAFAATGLPANLTLNTTTGVISGTPSAAGTSQIALTASNAAGTSAAVALTLTVTAPVPPSITTQPVGKAVGVDAGVTFTVVASGTVPLNYQWRKNGANVANDGRITGATTATLSIATVTTADAGTYSVVVSNGVNPDATSNAATLTVYPAGWSATHAVVGAGYLAGGTVTITNTINFTGEITGLGWSVLLPSGWTYAASSGNFDVSPKAGDITGVLGWAWTSTPVSPVTFTYTLNVPASETASQSLAAIATVADLNGDQLNMLAKPDPLVVGPVLYHTADTAHDWAIDLNELIRVISIYNTRFTAPDGKVQTGCYKVQDGTVDGFALDSSKSAPAAAGQAGLAAYHSADTNRDGAIDLNELIRVISLYNTRYTVPDGSGKIQTGFYKVQAGTVDGYAPDPTRAP